MGEVLIRGVEQCWGEVLIHCYRTKLGKAGRWLGAGMVRLSHTYGLPVILASASGPKNNKSSKRGGSTTDSSAVVASR